MSLISALSNSLSSLRVIQQNVSVISNNIANAGTEGYSKKSATLESVLLGDDFGGVRITGYERQSSSVVFNSLIGSLAEASQRSVQDEYLSRVQEMFGSDIDDPGVVRMLEDFASAWREMEASPEDSSAQRTVIQRGKELTDEIRRLSSTVEELERQIRTDLSDSVIELNTVLTNIRNLNGQIVTAQGRNQPSGDFEDQRDLELQKLAQLMDIKVIDRDQGRIAVYTNGGFMLLDGEARSFEFSTPEITSDGTPVTAYLTGGKLEALYDLRYDGSPAAASSDSGTEVIRKLRDQLEELADAFLDVTTAGTFGNAYNSASADASATPAELASNFFTGTGRTDIAVATGLLNGTASVKKAAAAGIVTAFNDVTRDYTPDGLTLSDVSYTGLARGVVAVWQQSASITKGLAETAQKQADNYHQRLIDQTGVNIDEELVHLQIIQNSYQATARLISVIDEMFDALAAVV